MTSRDPGDRQGLQRAHGGCRRTIEKVPCRFIHAFMLPFLHEYMTVSAQKPIKAQEVHSRLKFPILRCKETRWIASAFLREPPLSRLTGEDMHLSYMVRKVLGPSLHATLTPASACSLLHNPEGSAWARVQDCRPGSSGGSVTNTRSAVTSSE